MENLVELHMPFSRLKQLILNKPLRYLKRIGLYNSEKLTRILDLAKAPNVEVIKLTECMSLVDIGPSMGNLNKLTSLYLQRCKRLYQLPEISSSVEELYLNRSGIRQLPLAIGHHRSFWSLHFNLCPNFASRSNTICNLRSLKHLQISFCKSLNKLPEHLENLQSLVKLEACGSGLKELPSSFCSLRSLKDVDISVCKSLNKLPEHLGNLQSLKTLHASGSGLMELPSSICDLRSLTILDISDCGNLIKLPENLGNLQSLKSLYASGSGLKELPSSMCNLRSLFHLHISNCKNLDNLPMHLGNLESLRRLIASRSGLKTLPSSIEHLCKIEVLDLRGCNKLESLPHLPWILKALNAANCTSLKSASATFKFPQFILDLSNCQKLNEGALLWEIQYPSADKWPHLCIVGSEVPQWMKYRNDDSGSSLALELDAHGSSIHLIFCVVVAANPCRSFLINILKLYASLTDEYGCRRSCRGYGFDFSRYNYGTHMTKFNFDHVFFWFDRVEHNVRKVSFSTNYGNGDLKIIKCGVHPIIGNQI